MKKKPLLFAVATALGLTGCATPQTVTVSPAVGEAITFTTGKDVQSTAKAAALAAAAWYIKILTTPAK